MVPITCQMKECLNRTSNRTFMSFLEYWSGQRFSSLLDPRIGWDGWGCGVMASETEWFSIMPESKRREGSVWEMTKVGNADHVKLIQRALLLQAWSARIGQKKKKNPQLPQQQNHPRDNDTAKSSYHKSSRPHTDFFGVHTFQLSSFLQVTVPVQQECNFGLETQQLLCRQSRHW